MILRRLGTIDLEEDKFTVFQQAWPNYKMPTNLNLYLSYQYTYIYIYIVYCIDFCKSTFSLTLNIVAILLDWSLRHFVSIFLYCLKLFELKLKFNLGEKSTKKWAV